MSFPEGKLQHPRVKTKAYKTCYKKHLWICEHSRLNPDICKHSSCAPPRYSFFKVDWGKKSVLQSSFLLLKQKGVFFSVLHMFLCTRLYTKNFQLFFLNLSPLKILLSCFPAHLFNFFGAMGIWVFLLLLLLLLRLLTSFFISEAFKKRNWRDWSSLHFLRLLSPTPPSSWRRTESPRASGGARSSDPRLPAFDPVTTLGLGCLQ